MVCLRRSFAYEMIKTRQGPVAWEEFFNPESTYHRTRLQALDKLFKEAGMTSDIKSAYIAYISGQDKNNYDSDVRFILYFVPQNIHLYGLPNHEDVEYPTCDFIGRKGNIDRRRSRIVRHIWNKRSFYRECFSDSFSASSFFSRLWLIEDNHSMFLDHLKRVEKKLQLYVERYGKISNHRAANPWHNPTQMVAYEDLFSKETKPWNYLRSMRGHVTKVLDGDTIIVSPSSTYEDIVVRLDKIDAPEKRQPFGDEAKKYLESLILNTAVTIYYSTKDSYERIVGTVVSAAGVDVNLRLVSEGFAWHYKEYDNSIEFSSAEASACYYELNLWSEPHVKPSDWRIKHVADDYPYED